MNEFQLSDRLLRVAVEIPNGSTMADIGSDHAYLPCYAYKKGLISYGIAGEINEGPYQSALEQVKKSKLEQVIDVRKGDGLEVIKPGEVDVITIAGMGGSLIARILDNGQAKLQGIKRLILQPNVGAEKVRIWLRENNWELTNENILVEDDKVYEILTADRGTPDRPYLNVDLTSALLFGPFLMKEKNQAFNLKWSSELEKLERIYLQLENSSLTDTTSKRTQIQMQINRIEEVLK